MNDKEQKGMPWEKQREILIDSCALKLPLLHQSLIATYGEKKGSEIYEEVFETNYKRRSKQFEGRDIGDIMMAEVNMFPVMGWELWVEKKEENNEPVWFEHLSKCPHLDATRKRNLPLPCGIICDMDVKMAEKHKLGRWKRLKHMPSGDSECLFQIQRYK